MAMAIMAIVSMKFMAICSRFKNKANMVKRIWIIFWKFESLAIFILAIFLQILAIIHFQFMAKKKNLCPRPNSAKSFLGWKQYTNEIYNEVYNYSI